MGGEFEKGRGMEEMEDNENEEIDSEKMLIEMGD